MQFIERLITRAEAEAFKRKRRAPRCPHRCHRGEEICGPCERNQRHSKNCAYRPGEKPMGV